MVKLKSLTYCGAVLTVAAGCLLPATANAAEADGFKTFESQEYYEKHASELSQDDWYDDFASKLSGLNEQEKNELKGLHYYLRLDSTVDLNSIKTQVDKSNPDNVNRVIKLMPKKDFVAMFPNAEKGPCSYENFLKAVALLPGLFSDYKDFKKLTGIDPTDEMSNPDLIAKKILAAIMANAVQETSDTGKGDFPTLEQKVPGTFSTLKEEEAEKYNWISMGPFAQGQPWHFVAGNNIYSGRGVHQITYCMTYANISLFLYGDLRLVKYPDLLTTDTVLPMLTTLVYFVLPQSQYPTIAEVFDGQWERFIDGVHVDEAYKDKYKNEFPVCVLLINGGVECGQAAIANISMKPEKQKAIRQANNNTTIRGGAYHHFVGNLPIKDKKLFDDAAPEYDKSLTGVNVLKICLQISQNDTNTASKGIYQGLNWYRPFFLSNSKKPQKYYSDYMVFGGKNVEKLMSAPKQF